MRYRPLGRTGLEVSEIGFGAWGIGGDTGGAVAYGPADREISLQALRSALDEGITFFDTSDFYGFGRSEELIGAALEGRRAPTVVATKGGMVSAEECEFSARRILESAAASLKRLARSCIDLYQLHAPAIEAISDDTVSALKSLKRDGAIRAFGISARSPQEAKLAIERFGFECVQVNFNLVDQRAVECGLFDLALERKVGVIVRTPLSFGFLTGRYSAHEDFHAKDHRRGWDGAQRERWAQAHELFSALIESVPGQTPAQFALRYCLSHPCVSTVIPGMLTPAHVKENAAASAMGALGAEERAQIGDIYRRHEFFVKPRG